MRQELYCEHKSVLPNPRISWSQDTLGALRCGSYWTVASGRNLFGIRFAELNREISRAMKPYTAFIAQQLIGLYKADCRQHPQIYRAERQGAGSGSSAIDNHFGRIPSTADDIREDKRGTWND